MHWREEVGICRGKFTDMFTPESIPPFMFVRYVDFRTPTATDEILCNSQQVWDTLAARPARIPITINSYGQFHTTDSNRWLNHLRALKPNPFYLARVKAVLKEGSPIMGIHIRRTDHLAAIQKSPTEAFIKAMREYPPETRFFVATDSEAERNALKVVFGQRILTIATVLNRETFVGGVDAFLDFLGLSLCSEILGSAESSFSQMAAAYGGCPLKVIRVG